MRTARMTVLLEPEEKAGIERRAARLGISSGEFIRLAAERLDEAEIEAELAVLTAELEGAVPAMRDSLNRSIGHVEAMNKTIEDCLRTLALNA